MSLQLLNLPRPVQALAMAGQSEMASISGLLVGASTNSGQQVSQSTAIRASAVLACIRILMEDISQLPLRLHRRGPRGATLATEHSLYRLLDSAPNSWQTSLEMREGMVLDMLLNGTSFVEKVFGRDGIQELFPLPANRMMFKDVTPSGVARWLYSPPPTNSPELPVPNAAAFQNLRILLADDLWRVNLMAPSGYLEGRSLVLLAREAIGLALAAEEQGARLFSNGIQTDVVFTTADNMDPDQKAQFREALSFRHAGSSNSWRALLLDNGLDVKRIGLTAQESQYIETRQYQLQDIARIFRIPDVLLGVATGKTSTYASAEQFFLSYVKHTLSPWLRRFEQTISRDLLAASETDLFAKHDLDALLRSDLATRYAAHAVGISSGFLTRNEARTAEDLPMLEGLDEPVMQLNMGTGGPTEKPDTTPAAALARQLATNCVAHETKLLADGKSPADVYGRLLPGYLAGKTGLLPPAITQYCGARLETHGDEAAGVKLLAALLVA